jgi:hypothetical protein
MKRRRFRGQADSLDLLLDTICNAFGGIIFIACFVTLLVRDADTGPTPAMEEATVAMLERGIANGEADLRDLKKVIAAQDEQRGPRDALTKEWEELKGRVGVLRADAEKISTEVPPDPTGELQRILNATLPQRAEFEKLNETVAGQEKVLAELQGRAAGTTKGMNAAKNKSRQNVRLPRERDTNKEQFSVILKFHSIFPVWSEKGEKNTAAIEFVQLSPGEEIRPIDGRGSLLPRDRTRLLSQLRSLAGEKTFVVVCLFPDSHETWRDYARLIQEAGLEYGILFFQQESPVYIGSNNAGAQ